MEAAVPEGAFVKPSWIIASIVAAGSLFLLQRFLSVQTDSREPPVLSASIPIVGHIIQLFRKGADYLLDLERRYHQSLYILLFGKTRLYIVASPEWAQAIHKAHRSLQFNTLVAQAMENLFCMDKPAMEIIKHNMNGEDGTRSGILMEVHDMMFSLLAPGEHLDLLNKSILNAILPDVNGLAKNGPQQIQLWSWIRHHFSLASTNAVWGPNNPFAMYEDVEPAFWEFEANMVGLMMPMPSVFARKAVKARQRLLDTFEGYMANKMYDDPRTCQLVRNRANINMGKYGLSNKMHAYGDVSLLFGTLVNTIPSAFWLLSYIFEDKTLLSEIREELDRCVAASAGKRTINVQALRSACPLLNSCFREVLRITGGVNITRYVAEDINLTNSSTSETYLLKKGAVVLLASNVIHQRDFWGSDVATFNPSRFLQSSEKTTSTRPPDPAAPFRDSQGKVYSAAFRSFGGGNNICPGRFFAQTEILGLMALFVAGFEIEGASTPGKYKTPPSEAFKVSMGVMKPGTDVDVKVSRREGYEKVEWAFEM